MLLGFGLLAWFSIPHGIGFSWRECDTQAIARNFLIDGFDPLRPRVDWRGSTDGAVECEFPLYQLTVASMLAWFGEVEWPGRLLSLLATMFAGLCLHRLLEQRTGSAGALAGLVVFLTAGSTWLIGTRVMPDALCLGFAMASLTLFVRYLANGRSRTLAISMVALALAGLQKPLALQVGWIMFGWVLLLAPRRLREVRLWLGFVAVPTVVVLWLLHGKTLHEQTGLTFGVLSGGDTKFPELRHLLSWKIHAQLIWTTVQYGLSAVGIVALIGMVARRRFDPVDAVLLGSIAAAVYLSLRYSYHHRMGPHYHMFAAAAGAWCVARAWPPRAGPVLWALLALAVGAQGGWRIAVERDMRSGAVETPLMDVAASIQRLSAPTERIVVRSAKRRKDPFWNRRNNYEDPSLFYQTGLRGWVLPVDGFGVHDLERLRGQGASLVYDCVADATTEVGRWLQSHSELVLASGQVRVHRLRRGN